GFGIARFLLGLGEAGNFPPAIKATAGGFPRRERALATGIFNAGSQLGGVGAPPGVAGLSLRRGWQARVAGAGRPAPRRGPDPPRAGPGKAGRVSAAELNWTRRAPPDPPASAPWSSLLPHRQTWAVAAGKFLTDPVWWFYLFWSAKFLADRFGADLKTLGPPL